MKTTVRMIALALIVLLLASCAKVSDIPQVNAVLTFRYADKNVDVELSEEESKTLRAVFNNKSLHKDDPSCGFTKDVSVRFDNMIFCIACDTCPMIQYGDKYFSISEKDREAIDRIFEKYGGYFPCV